MTDDQFEALIAKFGPRFLEGLADGRTRFATDVILQTKWGPVEGEVGKDGKTVRWNLPNHEWIDLYLLPDHAAEMYRNDRLVARQGPVEIEQDEPEDEPRDA